MYEGHQLPDIGNQCRPSPTRRHHLRKTPGKACTNPARAICSTEFLVSRAFRGNGGVDALEGIWEKAWEGFRLKPGSPR